jgi:hypothetical protein
MTFSIKDTQHNKSDIMTSFFMLSVVMLSIVMLSVVMSVLMLNVVPPLLKRSGTNVIKRFRPNVFRQNVLRPNDVTP